MLPPRPAFKMVLPISKFAGPYSVRLVGPYSPMLMIQPPWSLELPLRVVLMMVRLALPEAPMPKFPMPPPPKSARLPLRTQLLTVSVAWSFQIPPPKAVSHQYLALPLLMLRPEMLTTVFEPMWITRQAWLPLTARWEGPGPVMVTFLVTTSSPLVNVMAPVTERLIVSPLA